MNRTLSQTYLDSMPLSHSSSEPVASSALSHCGGSTLLASSSLSRFASSSSLASSSVSRVLARQFSTQPRPLSSLTSVRFVDSSFSSVVARTLSPDSTLSRVVASTRFSSATVSRIPAPHLHPFQAPPNHAMQLTGSARHGSCSPQTRRAATAPRSACS